MNLKILALGLFLAGCVSTREIAKKPEIELNKAESSADTQKHISGGGDKFPSNQALPTNPLPLDSEKAGLEGTWIGSCFPRGHGLSAKDKVVFAGVSLTNDSELFSGPTCIENEKLLRIRLVWEFTVQDDKIDKALKRFTYTPFSSTALDSFKKDCPDIAWELGKEMEPPSTCAQPIKVPSGTKKFGILKIQKGLLYFGEDIIGHRGDTSLARQTQINFNKPYEKLTRQARVDKPTTNLTPLKKEAVKVGTKTVLEGVWAGHCDKSTQNGISERQKIEYFGAQEIRITEVFRSTSCEESSKLLAIKFIEEFILQGNKINTVLNPHSAPQAECFLFSVSLG